MQKSPDKKGPLNLAGRSTSDHFETSTNGGSKHSSRLQWAKHCTGYREEDTEATDKAQGYLL